MASRVRSSLSSHKWLEQSKFSAAEAYPSRA
jgi:hypothetical protein